MSKCTSTTKKGAPCKAAPITGTDKCLAHADEKVRETIGFGGSQPGAGRPKNPRAVDVLRERIERDIDKVLDPLWDALDATNGVVVGNGASAEVEILPDYRTRIAAARELLDRGYGRPKQQTELTGADGGPVVVTFDQLAARALSGE